MVSGSDTPRCNFNPDKTKLEFNRVLSRFSPKSKLKTELPSEEQIDILIGTDCISESLDEFAEKGLIYITQDLSVACFFTNFL